MTEAQKHKPLIFDPTDAEMVEDIRRLVPDMNSVLRLSNPIRQVMFRAGMLAMRKMIEEAAYDSAGSIEPDAIKAIWPSDSLGDNPGEPRLHNFEDLISDWGTPQQVTHVPSINREAACEAFSFLEQIGLMTRKKDEIK